MKSLKALFFLFLCTALLISEVATAQQRTVEKADAIDCADAKENPGGAEWCDAARAERAHEVADQRLNKVYRLFMEDLDQRDKTLWIDAQRKWLAFHKAHCNALAAKTHPSSAVRQWSYMDCLTRNLESRTQQLFDSCESEKCKHVK